MSPVEGLADRLALVVITDAGCAPRGEVVPVVEGALQGGAPCIQLRAKDASAREMLELAQRLRRLTRHAGALLVVNDRLDVALASGADGAHLGDDDLPLPAARRVAPPPFLLGRSVDTPEQAAEAQRQGADYVGVGPVWATPSKTDAGTAIGLEGLEAVRRVVDLPIVAIGGVDAVNAAEVASAGADGVAVIRAVMAAASPGAAARRLLEEMRRGGR